MIVRDWYRLFKVYPNCNSMWYILESFREPIIRLLEVVSEQHIRLDRVGEQIINEVLHIMTKIQHRVG